MKRNLIFVVLILAGFMLVFVVSLYGGGESGLVSWTLRQGRENNLLTYLTEYVILTKARGVQQGQPTRSREANK